MAGRGGYRGSGGGDGGGQRGRPHHRPPPPPWHDRTQLCNTFCAGQTCRFGSDCIFAHGEAELAAPWTLLDPDQPEMRSAAGRASLAEWVKPQLEAALAKVRICLQRGEAAANAADAAAQLRHARDVLEATPVFDAMQLVGQRSLPGRVAGQLRRLKQEAGDLWDQVLGELEAAEAGGARAPPPQQQQQRAAAGAGVGGFGAQRGAGARPASQTYAHQYQQSGGGGRSAGSTPAKPATPPQGASQQSSRRSRGRRGGSGASGGPAPPGQGSDRGSGGRSQAPLPPRGEPPKSLPGPAPAKAAPPTPAELLRSEGNAEYSAGLSPSLPVQEQVACLQRAAAKYSAALASSTTDDERASACKNAGMAAMRLLERCPALHADRERQAREELQHLSGMLRAFSRAADLGAQAGKAQGWLDECIARVNGAYYQLLDQVQGLQLPAALRVLERMRGALDGSLGHTGAFLLQAVADTLFQWGVTYAQKGDYKSTLTVNKEARRPLSEAAAAARRCGRGDLSAVLAELEASLVLQHNSCESVQARLAGDSLLDAALQGSEELDMEAVWQVVDLYKQAAVLTHEVDLEAEAVALSRLGRVYRRVLREHPRARAYYQDAVHLANAMWPRTFYADEWYSEARDAVLNYQRESEMRAEELIAAAAEPHLKKLAPQLRAVRAAGADSAGELLRHIYKHHPPPKDRKGNKHGLAEQPTNQATQVKRLLKVAIVHYHPDKAQQLKCSEEWKVLSLEISKALTEHYSSLKG